MAICMADLSLFLTAQSVAYSVKGGDQFSVGGSSPGLCHRVVSLDKKLYSKLFLFTQMYTFD